MSERQPTTTKGWVQPTEQGLLNEMMLFYLSIPVMLLGVLVATLPLLWAMKHQAKWEENATPKHAPRGLRHSSYTARNPEVAAEEPTRILVDALVG